MVTVGAIRRAIEGMDDSAPVIVRREYAGAEGGHGAQPTQGPVLAVRWNPRLGQLEIEVP